MSLFTFGRFEDVYRIIVLVSVILIKKDTARSLAVFRAGIARVVSQKAFCFVVFNDFLGDPEFSLEFRIPGKPIIDDVEGIFYLLFAVGHQLHMVLRYPIKRSLEKVRERSHETVFAVAAPHEDNDLREYRLIFCNRVEENEGNDELLIGKKRIVIVFDVLEAVPVCLLIKIYVLPLQCGLYHVSDQELPVAVYPFRVLFGVLQIVVYLFTSNHPLRCQRLPESSGQVYRGSAA